jgi:hypothetical protein
MKRYRICPDRVYPIRMNVYTSYTPTPEKSEVAEKCCWSKQLERNSFVTHQQLGTHTEGGGDERKRATGVLNPQKIKNKFLTHRNNWSKLFLECIALKFPGLNICCCFSTSKEEKKKKKLQIFDFNHPTVGSKARSWGIQPSQQKFN